MTKKDRDSGTRLRDDRSRRSITRVSNETSKRIITFEFDSDTSAKYFLSWMRDDGEQSYWAYMESVENEDPQSGITAIIFDYRNLNDNRFGPRVRAECDRLDRL